MTKQYMWWIRGLITVGPWARPDSIKMPPLSLASPDIDWKCCCSVAKSSLTWRRHGLQHACLPCLSLSPGVCSNSCPLSQWCYLINSSSGHHFLFLPSVFPSIRVFSNVSVFCMWWPKYWSFSFSISPSSEYSRLISFRIDWFVLEIQETLKSLL